MEVILKSGEFGQLIKLPEALPQNFKFSQLKELVEKELNSQSYVIIDDKGIDITSMHPDEVVKSDNKKSPPTFYVFNEQLSKESDLRKLFEQKYSQEVDLKNITINNGLIEQDIEERYNFKPIYAASSYIQGLDICTIQNFEQSFFNDYTILKQAFKKYKHRKSQGYSILKEVDLQNISQDLLRKSISKLVEHLNVNRTSIKKKFNEQYEGNQQTLKMYSESINELKRYAVHNVLRRDGKQYLMDFYYDEQQMNKWRDSCIRTQESYKAKFEKFDKEFTCMRNKYQDFTSSQTCDDQKSKDLYRRIETLNAEKEPLLISIISTVYEDLREFHKYLNVFCSSDPKQEEIKQAQQYFINNEGLKRKSKGHQELALQMEEHCKELEQLIEEIKGLQYKNAQQIVNTHSTQSNARKDLKASLVSHEYVKYMSDYQVRIEKDFGYLNHPQKLPRAYEKSLYEVQRRRKFRKIVDEDLAKLKTLVQKEKENRNLFMNEFGRILPSEFIPSLREQVMTIKVEGGAKDYELPEIEDINIDEYEEFRGVVQQQEIKGDPDLKKKYQELVNEQNLLKEEHKSNMKELNNKMQDLDCTLKMKTDKISELVKSLNVKDQDLLKQKQEIEKLMKNLKDTSLSFSLAQRTNEETIARKGKEVESLLKEKKCKNCILCLEDLKDKSSDVIVQDLNDRLMTKTKRIDQLEDQVRKANSLIHQICSNNFQFLRTKTQDFYKSIDQVKQSYENRLMEVEERLGLEEKRCQTVIKTRVATLEEKYLKSKQKEGEMHKKVKELMSEKVSNEQELKMQHSKHQRQLQEIAKLNTDCSRLQQDKKSMDEELKKLQVQLQEEKSKLNEQSRKQEESLKLQVQVLNKQMAEQERELKDRGEQIARLSKALEQVQEEKIKLEEKVKKENQLLIKQLNELKESSEKDMREKNENILRLNNIIGEHLDKSSEKSSSDNKAQKEILEKKDKEIAYKTKDLQEVTLILSKRDKEIQQLKKEVERVQSEGSAQIKEVEQKLAQVKQQYESEKCNEVEKMKEYMKSVESEYKQKNSVNKDSEYMLQRIKELTCTTLNIKSETWESGLTRALNACTYENINFMRVMEGARVLFMPHTPGVYVALVLSNVEEIEQNYHNKDLNISDSISLTKSESGPPVKRLLIKNNLFLDINSLSKNLQTILNTYQMIVIARVKSITKHFADSNSGFELQEKELYYLCQLEKLEHIVGFEGDEYSFTDYACR